MINYCSMPKAKAPSPILVRIELLFGGMFDFIRDRFRFEFLPQGKGDLWDFFPTRHCIFLMVHYINLLFPGCKLKPEGPLRMVKGGGGGADN